MKHLALLLALMGFPFAGFCASLEKLMVHEAWSPPVMQGRSAGVAYLTLHNPTSEDIILSELSSPQAGRVELHTHTLSEDGIMRMEKLDSLTVPAHSEIEMKPGGLHLMLFDLAGALTEGSRYRMTIKDGADTQTFDIDVKAIPATKGDAAPDEKNDKHLHHH
jgi:copper(I)-binding protein